MNVTYPMTKYVCIHLGVLCTYFTHTLHKNEREKKGEERERVREERSE
jgi:hypothetical protein